MTQRWDNIGNVLIFIIILLVTTLLGFLGGFVSGMFGLGVTAGIFLIYAGLGLIIVLCVNFFSQYYTKHLMHEMKEEENREAEQKDEKQLLFKPTASFIIFLLFVIVFGISGFFNMFLSKDATNTDAFVWFICNLFIIGFGLFFWYMLPVFLFAEDSVHIKSHLFYFLGIDRKTVIWYADITSIGPNKRGNYGWGVGPEHSLMISMNETTQGYGLFGFDDEIIAKIWLRFKEKLGDKVTMP